MCRPSETCCNTFWLDGINSIVTARCCSSNSCYSITFSGSLSPTVEVTTVSEPILYDPVTTTIQGGPSTTTISATMSQGNSQSTQYPSSTSSVSIRTLTSKYPGSSVTSTVVPESSTHPPSSTPDNGGGGGLRAGEIIAIIFGIVTFIGVVIAAIQLFRTW
jgi:hypothetical protein